MKYIFIQYPVYIYIYSLKSTLLHFKYEKVKKTARN